MADPTTITCDQGFWEEIATDVTQGNVYFISVSPNAFQRLDRLPRIWATYRMNGNPAPVLHPSEEDAWLVLDYSQPIESPAGIDVYVYPEDDDAVVVVAV